MKYQPDQDKPDGQYDTTFEGKQAVETVSTKESSKDGIEETKYDVTLKQRSRFKFTVCHRGDKYEAIDWSK